MRVGETIRTKFSKVKSRRRNGLLIIPDRVECQIGKRRVENKSNNHHKSQDLETPVSSEVVSPDGNNV